MNLVNHTPATGAREVLGETWDDYFSFTIERNPFDRVISQYFWEVATLADPPPIGDYLRTASLGVLSNWHLYTDGDRPIVDHVGKYESLDASLAFIAERLGLGAAITLPGRKVKSEFRRDRRPYRQVFSTADRRIIETVCHRELAAFGYAW